MTFCELLQLTVTYRFTTTNDRLGRSLTTFPGPPSLRKLSSRTHRMTSTIATTLTTPHRVGDRVHGRSADVGSHPFPAIPTRFTDPNLDVVGETNHSNR